MSLFGRIFKRNGDSKRKEGANLLPPRRVTQPATPKPARAVGNPLLAWYLEILALVITLGCVIAIAVLLSKMNGRPLADWKMEASFNTVIAILGTISRTTLAFAVSSCIGQQKWGLFRQEPDQLRVFAMFDQATRGPWGATRLMFLLRTRHWATLGALVTVGSLIFDPFLQASIGSIGSLKAIDSAGRATVGRATNLSFGRPVEVTVFTGVFQVNTSAGYFSADSIAVEPDLGFASAVYNAFYNSSASLDQSVRFTCETGNCTWPPYVSMGVCNSCADVTQHMIREHGHGENGSTTPQPSNIQMSEQDPYTRYNLPYGSISNYDMFRYSGQMTAISTGMVVNVTLDPSETIHFKDTGSLLASILTIKGSPEYLLKNQTWNSTTPVATECALYLCGKVYDSRVVEGVLQEQVTSSWAFRRKSSYQAIANPRMSLDESKARAWTAEHPVLYDIQAYRTDLQISSEPVEDANLHLNVTQGSLLTMVMSLFEAISGTLPPSGEQIAYPGVIAYSFQSIGGPPAFSTALFQSQNLSETFDRVAHQLTNHLRSNATMAYPGMVQNWIPYVRITWGFFALPLATVVLGFLYVLLSIIESYRLRIPIWTNDSLPTLIHGLDNEAQSVLRPLYGTKEGETKVNNHIMEFSKEEERLRLIQ
ncbi:hypothetical protein BU24DRAFT_423344 [Aaosphaeria arxii CBS 175.79]|uniref:Uncharacterized protein n=1 Tax=Aaosphaeria arxii CBS 175.79 TaxID=1450172 RepID=A0A6A5XNB0_9PLEO|nr:uncharacterized protein BU24DRAFT_423344 [Aaosphaeria arxii CBS 175.79]KAF2014379.1 hypothetical protein BU24DRAFT_423344 [Aaosphaeria arxii CBS 175.79]